MKKFVGFEAIAQGQNHKEKDIVCQDAVCFKPYTNGGVVVAADGHGSEKHFRSQYGAEIAVRITHSGIFDFSRLYVNDFKKRQEPPKHLYMEKQLEQLKRFIITRWRQEVIKHFSENPLTDKEKSICQGLGIDTENENHKVHAYGTTLIAALLQKTSWLVIQIGDGKSVLIDAEGNPSFAVDEDERLGFGMTTSLCDSNAAANFRHAFDFTEIKGITVATDGVSDSFIPEAYLELNKKIYTDFCSNPAAAGEWVKKGFASWSLQGSGDDASMAGIFSVPVGTWDKAKDVMSSLLEGKPKLN